MQLAGGRVPLGMGGVAAGEGAGEVGRADRVELVGQPVGPGAGLDEGQCAPGVAVTLVLAAKSMLAWTAGVLTGEPAAVAMQIWAAVHGAVSLEVDAPPEDPAGAGGTYWNLIRTVLVGLGAPPERLAAAARLAGVPLP